MTCQSVTWVNLATPALLDGRRLVGPWEAPWWGHEDEAFDLGALLPGPHVLVVRFATGSTLYSLLRARLELGGR